MSSVTLETVIDLAKQLSSVDKLRLIERMFPDIERELIQMKAAPRQSLRGVWSGVVVDEEDIAEIRQEMWQHFPREEL